MSVYSYSSFHTEMADVEPGEAETLMGEVWANKKATLLAVVQASNVKPTFFKDRLLSFSH